MTWILYRLQKLLELPSWLIDWFHICTTQYFSNLSHHTLDIVQKDRNPLANHLIHLIYGTTLVLRNKALFFTILYFHIFLEMGMLFSDVLEEES